MNSKINKIGKLDTDIAALRDRLESKLAEREVILAELVAEGEAIRAAVGMPTATVTTIVPPQPAVNRVLTVEQVLDIRTQFAAGVSQSAIARQYGLSQPAIHNIVRRRSYKDVA